MMMMMMMMIMCYKTLLIVQCYVIAWTIKVGHSRLAFLVGLLMEDLAPWIHITVVSTREKESLHRMVLIITE